MNAAEWRSADDIFSAFFRVVGAPEWHGKNFNALRDSVGTGAINTVEPPYRIVFANYAKVAPEIKSESDHFIQVIHELASTGVPVEIRVEDSSPD